MKLCIISDTHNKHKQLKNDLPDADVIIHCGDFTSTGKEHQIRNFIKWYSNLTQYKYKIIIAGNHDVLFEKSGYFARQLVSSNIIYLEDRGVEIEGLKFYGSPVQLPFGRGWVFNKTEEKLEQHWEAIPDDTDVLITHTPPFGVLDYISHKDEHTGSVTLFDHITKRIKPKISCFGHIHAEYGIKTINETTFINACNLDEAYEYRNKPVLIEI